MKKSEIAKGKFNCYNCAQSVLCAYSEDIGLDKKQALKIASTFGGGMGLGETCGVVTASYMVLGLRFGNEENDPEQKAKIKSIMNEFNEAFIKENGSLCCKELIGHDISTIEGHDKAKEQNVFDEFCPNFVASACDILDEIL